MSINLYIYRTASSNSPCPRSVTDSCAPLIALMASGLKKACPMGSSSGCLPAVHGKTGRKRSFGSKWAWQIPTVQVIYSTIKLPYKTKIPGASFGLTLLICIRNLIVDLRNLKLSSNKLEPSCLSGSPEKPTATSVMMPVRHRSPRQKDKESKRRNALRQD